MHAFDKIEPQFRGGAKTGRNPELTPQVIEINGRHYFMSYRLACQVAGLPSRKRKVWLGRNWRLARPVIRETDGSYRFVSGTHDV